MAATDLTSVSTFGWYTDTVVTEELTPISTFGWYFDEATGIGVQDLVLVDLNLYRIIDLELQR